MFRRSGDISIQLVICFAKIIIICESGVGFGEKSRKIALFFVTSSHDLYYMKIYKYILSLVLATSTCTAGYSQDLLGIEGEEASSIGVFIKDLTTQEVLYDFNSEMALTPASVMKAVTTATALSLLGEDFKFTTPVELRGRASSGGTWSGDLVIVSSGDPTVESENFKSNLGFCDSICASLRRMGVNNIEGTIVVEQSLTEQGPIAQWEIEDVAWPYGAGLYGMNFRDNTCVVYPLTGETKPHVPGLKVVVKESKDSNDLLRGVGSDQLTVFARDTKNKKWSVATTVPDPSAVLVAQLGEKLKAAGISVGKKAVARPGESVHVVYTHRSPAASEIMHSLMVRSDNLFAEGMLRAIAQGDTRDKAIKREKELWSNRGLDSRFSIIFDGSGLTRGNRLQPRFLADVLEWMAQSPKAQTYVSFFPKAGLDGTLRAFLAKTPLKGKIALKTGSMNAVQCYAGYKLDDDNRPTHVIVIMVNGFFCKRADLRKSIEDLLLDTFL